MKLTYDELRYHLHYDPLTGDFTRLVANSRNVKIGDIAGNKDANGYIRIAINSKTHKAHRLAWFYTYGYFPENDIDHINRIRHDNRIINLREVSRQCNIRNSGISKNNKSGVIGICWSVRNKIWQAQIKVNKKTIWLGYFILLTDAVKARWEAEVKYGYPTCNTTSTAYQYLKDKGTI